MTDRVRCARYCQVIYWLFRGSLKFLRRTYAAGPQQEIFNVSRDESVKLKAPVERINFRR